jgi:ribosomal protein S18 acetylase RimI-like enzyme
MSVTAPAATVVVRRPATADDDAFLAALYAANRAAELAPTGWPPAAVAAFCAQQHAVRERAYAAAFPGADDEVLLADGERVGRLLTTRVGSATHVVDLAVHPDHQGRGLGTAALAAVLASAEGPVRLTVRAGNPARRLYERLGFVVVADRGTDLEMEAAR